MKKLKEVNWFLILSGTAVLALASLYVYVFYFVALEQISWSFVKHRAFKVFWFGFILLTGYILQKDCTERFLRKYFVKHECDIITKEKVNYITWYIETFGKMRPISKANQILLVIHANESEKLKKVLFDHYRYLDDGMRFLFLENQDSFSKLQDEFMKEKSLPSWIIQNFIEMHDSKSLMRYINAGNKYSDSVLKQIYNMQDMSEVFISSCKNESFLHDDIELMYIKKCLETQDFEAIYDYTGRKVERMHYGLSADAESWLIDHDFERFRCYMGYNKTSVTETAIGKVLELAKNKSAAREALWNCYSRNLVTGENALELFKLSLENDNFTKYYDLFVESGLTNEMLAVLTLDNHVKVKMLSSALVYSHPDQ